MSEKLTNQVVLVIGASSGIGRETTILFAREGARVMAAARRKDRLRAMQQELAANTPIEIAVADAANLEDMEGLVKHTRERLGEIDILVYSAGINTPDRAFSRLTPKIWDTLMGVNINGAYYASQAVVPSMRQRGAGHLIYVSSISGMVPDVSGAVYQASKRGMLGLAAAIRVEEKENGIRTCVVCPGLVDTELMQYRPVKPTAETLAKALQPQDVAEVILTVAKLPARAAVPEVQVMPTAL